MREEIDARKEELATRRRQLEAKQSELREREQIYREQLQLKLEEERLAEEEQRLLARHEQIDRFELGLTDEEKAETDKSNKNEPVQRRRSRIPIWGWVVGIVVFVYIAPIGANLIIRPETRWFGALFLIVGFGALILGPTYRKWTEWLKRL